VKEVSMHSMIRALAVPFMVAFAAVSFESRAQATTAPDDVKNPPAKAPAAKKAEPKKSAAPKKAPAKTPTAARAATKPEPPRTSAKTPGNAGDPDFTVYKAGQSPPNLRDKDGNVIPSNPEAYDVTSGTAKKK